MTQENTNQSNGILWSENGDQSLHQFGFRSADYSKSNPKSLPGFLERIYDTFLKFQKKKQAAEAADRIAKLEMEIGLEKEKKNNLDSEQSRLKGEKEELAKGIEDIDLEIIDVKNGGQEENSELIPFTIGAFICVLLTLYLFVFYSSSGYSFFYGIKEGETGFINTEVFSDALNKGGGVLALILLFPVIFLGLGFLIHNTLEKNKLRKKEGKNPEYGVIAGLVFLTLVADMFIGYKIAKGVHQNEFNAGITQTEWETSMAFQDVNFYLVLLLGFIVYLIWGVLLHYVLSHPQLKSEDERTRLIVGNLSEKAAEKRKELNGINQRMQDLIRQVDEIAELIKKKNESIAGYRGGKYPIEQAELEASVGEFMGGWQAYTHGSFNKQQSESLVAEAIELQHKWLTEKINSFDHDN